MPTDIRESLGIERNNKWQFRQADGTILERWSGPVLTLVAGRRVGDEVVFALPGDMTLLGARTLEGLNFRVEPVSKRLVDAGASAVMPLGAPIGSGMGIQNAANLRILREMLNGRTSNFVNTDYLF